MFENYAPWERRRVPEYSRQPVSDGSGVINMDLMGLEGILDLMGLEGIAGDPEAAKAKKPVQSNGTQYNLFTT
jgi:hypothetical protein